MPLARLFAAAPGAVETLAGKALESCRDAAGDLEVLFCGGLAAGSSQSGARSTRMSSYRLPIEAEASRCEMRRMNRMLTTRDTI